MLKTNSTAGQMKRFFAAFAITLNLCALSSQVFALGTSLGTPIVNGHDLQTINIADTYGDLVIEYTSHGDSYFNTADNPSTSVVGGVFGDTITNPPDSEALPGNTTYYQIIVTNRGNAPDSFILSGTFANPKPGWYFGFFADTLSGNTINITATIAEDAETTVYAGVYIPTTALGLDTTQLTVTVSSNYNKADTGGYDGDNGVHYAGDGNDSTILITTATPQAFMFLSKTAESTAPVPGGYIGSSNDIVPGARLTYTIIYDNDGTDSAANISITEYIPLNTSFDTANTWDINPDSNNLGGGVIITYSNDGINFLAAPPVNTSHIRWTITNTVSPESYGTNADANGTANATSAPDYDAGILRFSVIVE